MKDEKKNTAKKNQDKARGLSCKYLTQQHHVWWWCCKTSRSHVHAQISPNVWSCFSTLWHRPRSAVPWSSPRSSFKDVVYYVGNTLLETAIIPQGAFGDGISFAVAIPENLFPSIFLLSRCLRFCLDIMGRIIEIPNLITYKHLLQQSIINPMRN